RGGGRIRWRGDLCRGRRGVQRFVDLDDVREGHPVGHALLPDVGIGRDDPGVVGIDDLLDRHVALIVLTDVDRVLVRRAGVTHVHVGTGTAIGALHGWGGRLAIDHDGGAALAAADLRQAILDFLVGDGVLGGAGGTGDFHVWGPLNL